MSNMFLFDNSIAQRKITLADLRDRREAREYKGIERVIFNDPATIVIWNDGTKTVVKCHEGDTYNEQTGLLMCIAKKHFGNTGKFNDVLHKWVPVEAAEPDKPSNPFLDLFNGFLKKEEEDQAFDWEEFDNCNIAVHCPTERVANDFLRKAEKRGYRWALGTKPTKENFWQTHKEDTVYIHGPWLMFGSVEHHKECGYKIIEWERELNKR